MKKYLSVAVLLVSTSLCTLAQNAKPVFKNGEAQIVEAFSNPEEWIREDLWVETEFDTDGDGKPAHTMPELPDWPKGFSGMLSMN